MPQGFLNRKRPSAVLNFPVSPFSPIIRTIQRLPKDFELGEEPRTNCGSELATTPTGYGKVGLYGWGE
jgi:hypothetical protein